MTTRNSLFILVFGALIVSCGEAEQAPAPIATPAQTGFFVSHSQFNTLRMRNVTLIDTVLTEQIEMRGRVTVSPESEFDLSLPFNGQVIEIAVSIGDEVKKGQALLAVRSAEYAILQERHLKARAQVDYLLKESERTQVLNDAEVTANSDRERIESELQGAEAALQSLRAQLEVVGTSNNERLTNRLVIRAPHSGIVTAIAVNQGHFLEAYQPAITLLDPSGMRLELAAFDHQVDALQPGSMVEFQTIGNAKRQTGVMAQIVPKSSLRQQAFRVIVERGKADWSALQPGLAVKAVAKGQQQKVLAFPSSALAGDPGQPSFFAVTSLTGESETAHDTTGYRYRKIRPEYIFVSGEWAGVLPASMDVNTRVLARGVQHISLE